MLIQITEPGSPSFSSPGLIVGIDLGTTHCVVAHVKEGKPYAFDLEGEGPLIPSLLTLHDGNLKVGVDLGKTLSSTKRLMGESAQKLPLGEYTLTPVEVAGKILTHLKNLIEKIAPLEAAVITVPAYFDETARVATKQAAALAGIKVMRLINEPTAAALAYGLETGAEGIYAIYDFGGGTFDISLLRLTKGVFQVLATGGDLRLGGDDIDSALAAAQSITPSHARLIKEKLTHYEVWDGIERTYLEALSAPLVTQTLHLTQETLKAAGLSSQDVQGIVLVGGMTRMPFIRQTVESFFQRPIFTDIDPDQAIALGAALSAHALTHGSDTLLLDVTPLSLGLETHGGLVEKIISRNTPLPALASQEFTTQIDGQTGMVIHVLQGEREFVKDCRSLAKFELRGLPPLPAGAVRVRIDFVIDVEGLLTVTATEKTSGLCHHVEVHPSHGLEDKSLKEILQESQKYGKEDIQNRKTLEETLKKNH